ncbi:MAG: hypothetical protein ACSHW7_03190 [Patiriisocius sp.]|uniref:hypothetical protein n=1 Tax=Patiriisocius sp. TaxID=2822396 RepID=UPI003EF2A1D8
MAIQNKNYYEIPLSDYRGVNNTSFLGRIQGNDVRKKLNPETLIDNHDKIIVKVPIGTTSINPSFFLGLFFDTIKKLGNIEKFKEKFIFSFEEGENETIREIILNDINEALVYARNSLRNMERGFKF